MSDGVIVSLIGGAVTVIVAIIGIITALIRLREARVRPERYGAGDPDEREAEERYGADPRAFIKDIMEDRRQYREEVAGYREEVAGLRQELSAFRDKDRKFRNALARWMLDILDAWGMLDTMPYPREGDQDLLADIIPSALEATQPRHKQPPV